MFATRPGAELPASLEADPGRRRLRTVMPMRRRRTDRAGPELDRPRVDQALRAVPHRCFERATPLAGGRLAPAWRSAAAALTLHTRLAGAVQASLASAAADPGKKGAAR
jgi:hypothetical protein